MSLGRRDAGRTLVSGRWVVGHQDGRHLLIERGEVVFEDGAIVFVGHAFPGEVARRIDRPDALIAPGFVDLDAVSDLDTAVLSLDNTPSWRKGRVWPQSYVARGPYEMYSPDELAFQKRYAFAQLLRNGVTTALPIASLFYRQWGETYDEFAAAAQAAEELGLRVYLGPAYRSGHTVVDEAGTVSLLIDEARGLAGLDEAVRFCRDMEGRAGGLVRTMLAPDRIEGCTPELLRRTAEAARALDVPLRLHCHQSRFEVDEVAKRHGLSPTGWLASLGLLGPRVLLPHFTDFPAFDGVSTRERDLATLLEADATVVHCPVVMARNALRSARTGAADRAGHRHLAAGHDPQHAGRPDARAGDGALGLAAEQRRDVRRRDLDRGRCARPAGSRTADAGRAGRSHRDRFRP